jgi:hypothetical protein
MMTADVKSLTSLGVLGAREIFKVWWQSDLSPVTCVIRDSKEDGRARRAMRASNLKIRNILVSWLHVGDLGERESRVEPCGVTRHIVGW